MTSNVPPADTYLECTAFYNREAELLDDRDLKGWLELLADDVDYRVPRRLTRERGDGISEFSENAFHFKEDYGSLEARVRRFDNEYAWSQNPPARTRRFVSNIRPEPHEEDVLAVKNNLLMYYSQGDTSEYEVISAERDDRLRTNEDGFVLASRLVRLDQSVLSMNNLSVFL